VAASHEPPGTTDYLVVACFNVRAQTAEDAVSQVRDTRPDPFTITGVRRDESGGPLPTPTRLPHLRLLS
jgi:hypothetical protein